jgi:palmitoyltransferase
LGLLKCLETNNKILIKDLVDHRGYTLLHLACFKNLDDIVVTIIQVARNTMSTQVIKDWINFKTDDDGFTALHFASFRGNLKLIELLLINGADMY